MKPSEQTADAVVEPGATDKLMSDLQALAADVEQVLGAASTETGRRIASGRTRARESLNAAVARSTEMRNATLAKAREAGHAADDYVHGNAWQVIAIGAAAGFLLGCLVGGRVRSES